jgi:S-adenosylmethionine decarboxylase
MHIIGKHVFGELYGVSREVLSNADLLCSIAVEAGRVSNMTVYDVFTYSLGEYVAVFVLVVESHISLHAYPSLGYASVDVYTCGDKSNPEAGFNYIVSRLKPVTFKKYFVDRSSV